MDVRDIVTTLRPLLPGALIALDFDGTLAPIVPDPQDSRPVAGTLDALQRLAGAGAQVAVVTGRDAATVVRLGGLDGAPGIHVAGLYGAETWHDGTLDTLPTPEQILQLRAELPGTLVGADPDVWIEDKRLSLVVHTRLTADPSGERDRVAPAVTDVGRRLGFDVELGNGVVELRLPGFDKGGVLHRLAEGRTAVLYAGDDLGDVPAFEAVRSLRASGVPSFGVGVEASGVPEAVAQADVRVPDAAACVELLASLVG